MEHTLLKEQELKRFKLLRVREEIEKIDVVDTLIDRYCGDESEWQKKKGFGYVDYEGESYRAELHWYEEPSVGRHEWKVKPDADGNWFYDED